MDEKSLKMWEEFQKETGYYFDSRDDLEEKTFDVNRYPGAYKRFENAIKRIPLVEKDFSLFGGEIGSVLARRRSLRNFLEEPLSLEELSFLLWGTQGITARLEGYQLRTAASAGALYPVDTYLAVADVEDLPKGIYHFNVEDFELDLLKEGDFVAESCEAALGQELVHLAAVTFFWTANIMRSGCKYWERAIRYVYLDAGHISQNLLVCAAALERVGATAIGAFYDDLACKIIGVDPLKEPVILMASVGKVSGKGFEEDRRTYIERMRRKRA